MLKKDKSNGMLLYITIIILCVILDQASKYAGVLLLSGVTTLPIIPNVFHLTYVENTGAAFSLFSDMRVFLIIVTTVFTIILGYLFFILPKTKKYHTVNLALSLMIGGALGNLLDRIRLGYIVDLFDFKIIGFAIFNLADCFVVVGGLLLILALVQNKNLLENPKKMRRKRRRTSRPRRERQTRVKPAERDLEVTQEKSHLESMSEEERKRITPEVHSSLRRLRTNHSVDFEPTPRIADSPTQEFTIPTKTRQPLEYEDIVEKKPQKPRPANRYRKSSQHYEDLVRQQRDRDKQFRENRESSEEISTENPWAREEKTEEVVSETKIWDVSEVRERPQRRRSDRYTGVLDSYEASVNEQRAREKAQKKAAEEPVEEKPKRRKVGVERYTDETDSYLRSIQEASKKHYTDD